MENRRNIILLCKDCSDQRRKDFQKTFDKYSLEVGDMIKANFGNKEHMWVEVKEINLNGINGILCNEPIAMKNLENGEDVFVLFKDIEGHIKKKVHNKNIRRLNQNENHRFCKANWNFPKGGRSEE